MLEGPWSVEDHAVSGLSLLLESALLHLLQRLLSLALGGHWLCCRVQEGLSQISELRHACISLDHETRPDHTTLACEGLNQLK